MKKKKNIDLKNVVRVPHLRRWCGECRTMINAMCLKNGKAITECECPEKISFRYVRFIPGEKRRIVRALGKDLNQALKQIVILNEQIENGSIEVEREKNTITPVATPAKTQTEPKPESITHIFGRYLASLAGEGVASHLKLVRSKGHINSVKSTFKHTILAIRDAGFDPKAFRLTDICDDVIGRLHDRLLAKGYSSNTYNRTFSHLTTFASWAEREGYESVKRFFERVPRKKLVPRPEIISAEEFEKTIAAISYENGWQEGIGKRKARRNHYRDYLIPAFRFALYTGRRLEEIITCKFSDLHTDAEKKTLLLEFTDWKASRILHLPKGEELKVFSPVQSELLTFLKEQGLDTRDPNDFIIAPELIHRRVAVLKQELTRGFSHFYNVAHPDSKREVSFKTLRKTFLTNLAIHMGKDVTAVSGHSGTGVLKHYLNEKQISAATSMHGFSVFGKEKELQQQRKKIKTPEQTIER